MIRTLIKKGRRIRTREPEFVLKLAEKIYKRLSPLSKKIEIVGSIRRKISKPADIDIVLIPKSKEEIRKSLEKIGKYKQCGEKRIRFVIANRNLFCRT